MDTGGLAQMTYHPNNTNNNFASNGLSAPGAGFGGRTRLNAKRLSVALPPKVNSISEHQVDNPTPRTSRSHLLAGLRTQPKTPSVPASAPYNQTQHQLAGFNVPQNGKAYNGTMPQSAAAASFDLSGQYVASAGRQMYSLPEQVLAPPSLYDQGEEMDPNVLQQMQMTSMFLAQRQQQLQQQLANITAAAQGMSLNAHASRNTFMPAVPATPQTPQNLFGQQQVQEVPGQPGVYLVYNAALQSYSYYVDQAAQQRAQLNMSPYDQQAQLAFSGLEQEAAAGFMFSPPGVERSNHAAHSSTGRSFTPPKKAPSPPMSQESVEPLPPPSATAFRRGHKKASSLAINSLGGTADGPKTSSAATFGAQRVIPPTPMTGTFGPGAARAGEHPVRQPRGPPPLEELVAAPTSKHEGSKNFATRQRRRALDSLMKAGTQRRGISRSTGGSPASEGEFNFLVSGDGDELPSINGGSRKMSPIGSEMKEKRGSRGSTDGYFGLSSASSSEGEEVGVFKQPSTPATPVGGPERKKVMLNMLSAAAERRGVGA